MQINDQKLSGLDQEQCTLLIRESEDRVELVLAREQESQSDDMMISHDEDGEQAG